MNTFSVLNYTLESMLAVVGNGSCRHIESFWVKARAACCPSLGGIRVKLVIHSSRKCTYFRMSDTNNNENHSFFNYFFNYFFFLGGGGGESLFNVYSADNPLQSLAKQAYADV